MSDVADAVPSRGHKKKARTRRRLIDAAIAVIAEQGEGFSIHDVTDRADVSNGTFYNYFPDRDALIEAVVPEVVAGFVALSAATVDHDDPAMQFAIVSAVALRRASIAPDRLRVLLRLDAAQRALLDGAVLQHLRADLERGVVDGRFEGEVDDATVDLVAGTLLLAIHRIVEHPTDDGYPSRVVAQLVRSLGIDAAEAAELGREAVAVAEELRPLAAAG